MSTSEMVPLSRIQKIVLREKPLKEVAQELLTVIPIEEAPEGFPELPKPITATDKVRKALKVLATVFNKTIVTDRRTLSTEEIAAIGVEYEALKEAKALLVEREEQIKEIVRTHQDVEAEQNGQAFPVDVRRNGNVIAKATPRDANGHYILAAKGEPVDTSIPGTTLRFSNQFSSGRVKEDLAWVDRAYAAAELDEDAYKAMTVVRRVPDADKIKSYVLKTGNTSILSRIVKKGRDSQALYLRSLKKN